MKSVSVKKLPLHWSTWSPVEIAIGLVWLSNGLRLEAVHEMFRGSFTLGGLSILWTDLVHFESDLDAREVLISHTKRIDVRASGLLYLVPSSEL